VRQAARDRFLDLLRRRVITPEQLAGEKKEGLPAAYDLKGSDNTVWAAKHDALDAYRAEQKARD
jgi:hypothetical protein